MLGADRTAAAAREDERVARPQRHRHRAEGELQRDGAGLCRPWREIFGDSGVTVTRRRRAGNRARGSALATSASPGLRERRDLGADEENLHFARPGLYMARARRVQRTIRPFRPFRRGEQGPAERPNAVTLRDGRRPGPPQRARGADESSSMSAACLSTNYQSRRVASSKPPRSWRWRSTGVADQQVASRAWSRG